MVKIHCYQLESYNFLNVIKNKKFQTQGRYGVIIRVQKRRKKRRHKNDKKDKYSLIPIIYSTINTVVIDSQRPFDGQFGQFAVVSVSNRWLNVSGVDQIDAEDRNSMKLTPSLRVADMSD